MKNKIGKEILELRSNGYSYNKIMKELGCSKSTVHYHCTNAKDRVVRKNLDRRKNNPDLAIMRKIYSFCVDTKEKKYEESKARKLYDIVNRAIWRFSRIDGRSNRMFSPKDFFNKFTKTPKCALTGRDIDLLDTKSYELDHIVPRAHGGTNELDNCQILCRDANRAKNSMLQDDFIKLCREIVAHDDQKRNK